jgi:DnaJ-class molecular chaperone
MADDDPYRALGIERTASDKQIRSAFLKLAKTTHPDLNPGDQKAEGRFKAISAANELLSDPDRRARFDRGEIDAAGHDKPPPGPSPGNRSYRDYAEGPFGPRYNTASDGGDEHDLGDILSGIFSARGRAGKRREGSDRRYKLAVPFLDAVRGNTQRLILPEGGSLDVHIPPGLESGQILRLRGKGDPGDPPGDALIEVVIAPHKLFRRSGRDIEIELPITLGEAVLGGRVTVPTSSGPVAMTVPKGTDSGTRLRLRGKGVPASGALPAGDEYAIVRVVLGPSDEGLASFLRDRKDAPAWNPRSELEDAA